MRLFTPLLALGTTGLIGLSAQTLPSPAPPPDRLAPPSDASRTPSGLATRVLGAGRTEKRPRPGDYVTLHLVGWTMDGQVFENSPAREEPLILPLERLMAGLREGLQLMAEGESRRLWIPEALAFAGAAGRPKGDLVLDVQLLSVDPPPSQAPADLLQPPPEARLTPTGLVVRTLRPGTGARHPTKRSHVNVHYTGWTLDGKMFDSSVLRRSSGSFKLDEVIKGWTEGIQLMVACEKARFWIPEKLAYRGERDKPKGPLVFDVELLSFWE